jgi:hypothetical protein
VAGSYTTDATADASGSFSTPAVPLQAGANTITGQATDLAGNIGPPATLSVTYEPVDVIGSLGPLATEVLRGQTLAAPFSVSSTGTTAYPGLQARILLQPAAGGASVGEADFALDLAAGATVSGTEQLATASLAAGTYTATLQANLPAGGWTTLASAATQVVVEPCWNGDAASSDEIFCDGFENLTASLAALAPIPTDLTHLVAPAWRAIAATIPELHALSQSARAVAAQTRGLSARRIAGQPWQLPDFAQGPSFGDRRGGVPVPSVRLDAGITAVWVPDSVSGVWQ